MKLPFYFDYACPWAYLGSCRVEPYFQDLGVELDFLPVSLKQIVEPAPDGSARPQLGERKKRNYAGDLRHWGELVGAEFASEMPKERPDSTLLLQAAHVAKAAGRFREFHYPAYRARWAEGRDIAQPEVVGKLLEAAGIDAGEGLAKAQSDQTAEELRRVCDVAIERGVFGVPTMFVGDEMFWGNDRFELVRHYVQKARG
jgi:2-hydroxychromene-2-carboxylate isomerase